MIDECRERSKWVTTVDFTDQDGAPIKPSAADYRIDDIGSLTVIRDWTAIGSLATSIDIDWATSDTQILDQTRFYETRRMTVRWTYGGTQQNQREYLLSIKNLFGAESVSPA